MLDLYYKHSRVRERLRGGALGKDMDRIAKHFSELGYKTSSVKSYLGYIAQFSRFAAKCKRRNSFKISRDIIARFLRTRSTPVARAVARCAISHAARCASERFPQLIRRETVAPQERLLAAYKDYELQVRGLQPATCEALVLNARRMIEWCHKHLPDRQLSKLTGEHVLALVHDFSSQYTNTFTRCRVVAYVRSFLRYLRWAGLHKKDLARFVPRARSFRLAHLPARLSWEDIRRAIDAIDITEPIGMRDRAMLLLFATTGIRSGELRSLELSDIHWKAGEILIRRTKNYRDRVVPLLQEPGEALAEYVLRGRPKSASARAFLTQTSPIRPLASSGTISWIVHNRLERGGLVLSRGGAHLLRHSLATNLVGQARPINEVADLLGHSHIDSTAIYVKVALPQLAKVAMPFPGGAR